MNHSLQEQGQVPSQSSEVAEEGKLLSKFQKDAAYLNVQRNQPAYMPYRIPKRCRNN
jgi:hypothetical protein